MFVCLQKTHAYHHYKDDVPEEVKQQRLKELIAVHRRIASERNVARIGSEQLVLIQGVRTHAHTHTHTLSTPPLSSLQPSKRSSSDLAGRSDGNIKVIVPDVPVASSEGGVSSGCVPLKPGDYVSVKVGMWPSPPVRL